MHYLCILRECRGGASPSVACVANFLVGERGRGGTRSPGEQEPRAGGAAERGHGQARAQDAARGRALRSRRHLLRLRVAPPARARLSSPSTVAAAAFHACGHLVACLRRSYCRGRRASWASVPDCCLICLCISRVTLAPDDDWRSRPASLGTSNDHGAVRFSFIFYSPARAQEAGAANCLATRPSVHQVLRLLAAAYAYTFSSQLI